MCSEREIIQLETVTLVLPRWCQIKHNECVRLQECDERSQHVLSRLTAQSKIRCRPTAAARVDVVKLCALFFWISCEQRVAA